MSKIDPRDLMRTKVVDERTTLLLQVARSEVDPKAARQLERELSRHGSRLSRLTSTRLGGASMRARTRTRSNGDAGVIDGLPRTGDHPVHQQVISIEDEAVDDETENETELDGDIESIVEKTEDPGIDSVRGSLGIGAIGSYIRARKRANTLKRVQSRTSDASHTHEPDLEKGYGHNLHPSGAIGRTDSPVSNGTKLANSTSAPNLGSKQQRPSSVRFADSDSVSPEAISGTGTETASPRDGGSATSNLNIIGGRPPPARSQTLPGPNTAPSIAGRPGEEELDEKKELNEKEELDEKKDGL